MKRFLPWMAIGILVLVLVLAAIYAFRQQLIAPYIEDRLVAELESRYGVTVAIGEIDGNFVTSLELAGVETVETTGQGPVTRIALGRGQAHYWLPDLLAGFSNLVQEAEIVLEGARVSLDFDRLPADDEAKAEQPGDLPSPAEFPDLRIRDSRLLVEGRGLHLEITGLDAELSAPEISGAAPARLDLQAATATLDHPRIARETRPLAAHLSYDQEQLVLGELRFGEETIVRRAVLDLTARKEGIFALEAALQLFEGAADLRVRLAETNVAGRLQLESIDLGSFSSALILPELPSLAGTLDGTVELRADPDKMAETLGGEVDLRVEEGRLRQVAADSLRLEATAREGNILVRRFAGRIGANRLTIDGIGIPAPAIAEGRWERLLAASPGTFSLEFAEIPALLTIAGLQPADLPEKIPEHRLELQGQIGNRSLAVSRGLLQIESGVVAIRTARFELPPQDAGWSRTAVEAGLTVDLPQLAEIGSIFGIPRLHGALDGDIEVDGTLGAPRGRARFTGKNLVFRGTSVGDLQLAAEADRQAVQVNTLTMERAGDFVRGQGILHLEPRRIEELALDFSLAAVEHYTELLPIEVPAAGGFTGTLTAEGPLAEPTITLRAALDEATVAGLAIPAAKVALESRGRTIAIEEGEVTTPYGSATLAGTVERGPGNRQFTARLGSLHLATREGGELRLAEPATLSYSLAGALAAEDLTLRGNIGEIYADGRLDRQGSSKLKVRLADLTSRYWLSLLTEEEISFSDLDAALAFAGTLEEPELQTSGQVAAIRLPDVPFPVKGAFDLDFDAGGLTVRRLEMTGADELELSLTGSLPLNPWRDDVFLPGELSLAGRIDMPSLELLEAVAGKDIVLEGALGGDLQLEGTWADPEGHLQLYGWELRIDHPDLPVPPRPLDLSADVAVRGDELRLQTLRLASSDLDFTASGQWTQGPSLRDILRGRDLRLAGNFDFQGTLDMPEIAWLARDVRPIRRLGGSLQADLSLAGPARDPEVDGTIRMSGGALRTTEAIPPIEDLVLTAELEGRRLLLQEARGELGSAPFSLSGSIAKEEGKTLFDLALQGGNLLLFRNDWMMIRADSDLEVTGPLEKLAVSGKLAITNGYYARNVDFLDILRGSDRPKTAEGLQIFSIRAEPLSEMTFNVKIGAKNPFRIENNVAKAKVRPDLTLAGTGELPVLLGRAYVDESTIRLPTTRLRVQSGLVQFMQNRPNRPSIDLLAETKMAGYDINMQIEGTYSEPVVTLSSVPPLPHDDLLLLLLAGRLPANGGGRETARTGGINIAMYVGKGLLADWFRDDAPAADEESLLERLQVEVGRGITQKGRETLEARLEIAEDLLKKEDVLYLTAERDIYDEFNLGIKIVFRFK